jgi:hypothetical protein
MRRIWLAIRVFFVVLFNRGVAEQVGEVLAQRAATGEMPQAEPAPPQAVAKPAPATKPAPRPVRSESITLLATLQREARLVDFLKEPLDDYNDAQIGAAVRDVHRDCGKVLDRLFALRPVLAQEEGAQIEVPAGFDAGRYRLTGNVLGEPPFHGRLVHHGWEATICQLPAWSGTEAAARVVAPVEVELT